jgi:hypothetical protein
MKMHDFRPAGRLFQSKCIDFDGISHRMKRLLLLALGGLSLGLLGGTLAPARADLVVVQRVEGGGRSGEMVLKLRDARLRVDISEEVSAISDLRSGEILTLMHPQKRYTRIDAEGAGQLLEFLEQIQSGGANGEAAAVRLERTGQRETVQGFETEIYAVRKGKTTLRFWIAKAFPQQALFQAALRQVQQTTMAALARKIGRLPESLPGVPVKTELTEKGGGVKFSSTLVSVQEKPVSPSEFQVPPGYEPIASPLFPGIGGVRPPVN